MNNVNKNNVNTNYTLCKVQINVMSNRAIEKDSENHKKESDGMPTKCRKKEYWN